MRVQQPAQPAAAAVAPARRAARPGVRWSPAEPTARGGRRPPSSRPRARSPVRTSARAARRGGAADRALSSPDVLSVRRCSRTGCTELAVATLTYVYPDSTAVVGSAGDPGRAALLRPVRRTRTPADRAPRLGGGALRGRVRPAAADQRRPDRARRGRPRGRRGRPADRAGARPPAPDAAGTCGCCPARRLTPGLTGADRRRAPAAAR